VSDIVANAVARLFSYREQEMTTTNTAQTDAALLVELTVTKQATQFRSCDSEDGTLAAHPETANFEKALTAPEAFRRLRIRDSEGYTLLESGQIKARKLPNGRWRISPVALTEYLQPPTPPTTTRRRRGKRITKFRFIK